MKTLLFAAALAATVSAQTTVPDPVLTTDLPAWAKLLPTVSPTVDDGQECATETYETFFSVPKPTGDVLKAIQSHGEVLRKASCTLTGADELDCPYPDGKLWCGVTSSMPASVSAGYAAYGSSASAWWAEHSSAAVKLATDCPRNWFDELEWSNQARWLNNTIIMAECYVEGKQTGGGSAITTGPTATPRPAGSGTQTVASTTTSTNRAVKRNDPGLWAVLGGGVAAMAAGARAH
ncbi:hypothetical protein QBC34DRAFT_496219 [Podospora aff. communis PSN243]|uniref:DUF7735 domain-containing protein n=1 Tax=Podospora aff. communis PSN243 TaxID=3040156 RepID=A0AAV9GIW9_9PEZI|nr:hypothetical protein QBC34DRAFT_496219 [Podospora aff. communis PSN243]